MANYNDWNRNRGGSNQDWDMDDERNYRNQSFDSDRQRSGSPYGNDRGNYGSNYDTGRYRSESDRFRGDYDRSRFGSSGDYPGSGQSDWGKGYSDYDYNRGREGSDYNRSRDEDYRSSNRGWWDRTKDEVSSWFGDDDAQRRRRLDELREGPYRGKGPKGYTRSDERIKEDVNDRLNDDPNVDASEIEVTVSNAEVTLTGTVNNRWEKRRAEDIAEGISGVKNVENRIKVNTESTVGSQTMGTGSSRSYKTSGETSTAASTAGAYNTSKNRS